MSNRQRQLAAPTRRTRKTSLWHGLFVLLLGSWLFAAGGHARADDGEATPYRLGSGDRVRVTVFGHGDLSGEFDVDGTGRIALPLIQVIDAAGKTTAELATDIADRLQPDYLKDPRVSIDILSYRPFYILGEVRNPGSYPFVTDMTVVAAVALAGGYTYRAGRKKITVIRGSDPDKKKRRVAEDALVMPGDVLEIPERFF